MREIGLSGKPVDEVFADKAEQLFESEFGVHSSGVWSAPGRVNFIGEHVDYAGGRSLPYALGQRTWSAARNRDDGLVRIVSEIPGTGEIVRWEGELSEIGAGNPDNWAAYAAGTVWMLNRGNSDGTHPDSAAAQALSERGDTTAGRGIDLAIVSNVPLGAGLSSSAAVELSVALAVLNLAGIDTPVAGEESSAADTKFLIDACIAAENIVAGAATGGMDQVASFYGREGMALDLDMNTGSVGYVPFDTEAHGLGVLVMNTNTPHSLHDGQYASRRAIIDDASEYLNEDQKSQDVPLHHIPHAIERSMIWAQDNGDDSEQVATIGRRVRHVVRESQRTIDCIRLLSHERPLVIQEDAELTVERPRMYVDFESVGTLLTRSHMSLQLDYEVSCTELDSAVYSALEAGALGARMVGGGFGGSAIALAPLDKIDDIKAAVSTAAQKRGLPELDFVLTLPSEGARRDR